MSIRCLIFFGWNAGMHRVACILGNDNFYKKMPPSPVETWSIQDVQAYLDELGLLQLKAIFLKNGGASAVYLLSCFIV